MEKTVRTLEEFEQEAAAFVRTLTPHDQGATLITLSGNLGAGKTAFTKAAAKELGIAEHVTSPTFVLEKIYDLPDSQPYKRLVHIDAYRLEGSKELPALGFDELMDDAGNLVFFEWPEKVAHGLSIATRCVKITANDDGSRTISYS